MQAVAGDGARLSYTITGVGPTVVLLHGLADTQALWRYVAPRLARRFRVVTMDTRGHGASTSGTPGWDMSTLVDDVLAVAEAARAERFAIAGLSMGGGIATGVTLAAPERVWLLGLVSTSAAFQPDNQRRFRDRADKAVAEGMASVVDATVPRLLTPAFRAAHPDVVEDGYRIALAMDPRAFAAASRVNAARDWTARLAEIRCPVIYLAGREDVGDVDGNLAVYRAALPRLEAHVLDGAAHLVPVERPLCCTRLLRDALERAAPRS
jgi:3-oxoadipate enol-lactonase